MTHFMDSFSLLSPPTGPLAAKLRMKTEMPPGSSAWRGVYQPHPSSSSSGWKKIRRWRYITQINTEDSRFINIKGCSQWPLKVVHSLQSNPSLPGSQSEAEDSPTGSPSSSQEMEHLEWNSARNPRGARGLTFDLL